MGDAQSGSLPMTPLSDDPAKLAADYQQLTETVKVLEAEAQAIREKLKGMLLGEATEPPEGGWIYGPVTVQYVKASERTSINRKKLVAQGVTLEQIVASMDVTKLAPTIRVVKTGVVTAE